MDCLEFTCCFTSAALYALSSVDNVGILDCACDSADGALSCTKSTAAAKVGLDNVVNEVLTYACGALLVNNVSDVFFTEELECCKNGVGSCLTETAE